MDKSNVKRCEWLNYKCKEPSDIYIQYHDEEWGVEVHEDNRLFEFLILEGAQAGLSWETILKKRDNYRKAYDNFDPAIVANYDDAKQQELLQNAGIVRNRLKIAASITNAKNFLKVQKEHGSFDNYIWQFTGHKSIQNNWQSIKEIPATTKESDEMSKDLKKKGFKFVGSTICYAFMQAIGMVNDHTADCYKYKK
jgi:DNA-3-methyladenine glycosylase I